MLILFNNNKNNNTDHGCAPTAEPQNVNLSENGYRLLSTQHTTHSLRCRSLVFLHHLPCTRHGPHTLSRTIPIQRAIKDHAASRVLLTACYLAPALLLPFSNRPCFCLHPTFLLQRLHVPLCGRDESKASNNQKGCYLRQGGSRCNFA